MLDALFDDRAARERDAAFAELRDAWVRDTAHLSSLSARVQHPAYQQIIALGAPIVPRLLRELAERPTQWAPALRAITGEDPVPANDRGTLRKECDAWLAWGRRNRLC